MLNVIRCFQMLSFWIFHNTLNTPKSLLHNYESVSTSRWTRPCKILVVKSWSQNESDESDIWTSFTVWNVGGKADWFEQREVWVKYQDLGYQHSPAAVPTCSKQLSSLVSALVSMTSKTEDELQLNPDSNTATTTTKKQLHRYFSNTWMVFSLPY